jgi:hypothetical protein
LLAGFMIHVRLGRGALSLLYTIHEMKFRCRTVAITESVLFNSPTNHPSSQRYQKY